MQPEALLVLSQRKAPIAPRTYRGQMCGVRVPGLPAVPGGAADPSLVVSWLYPFYRPDGRTKIRAAWANYPDVLLSWPDARARGFSADSFAAICDELIAAEFRPALMLCSKDFDPADVSGILSNIAPLLPLLPRIASRVCIGWELSLWLSPTQVQELIDAIAPPCVNAGIKVYVHFGERVFSWQQDGQNTAAFWAANVGKLTGILAQKALAQDDAAFLDWIHDCLTRCAGNFFMPTDSGFGHPFDFVMLEISAALQFSGACSEAEGDRLGRLAINAPAEHGPAGTVKVLGSGNGQ